MRVCCAVMSVSREQQLKGCRSRLVLDLPVPASALLTRVCGAGASSTLRLAILEGELQAKVNHHKDASMAFQVSNHCFSPMHHSCKVECFLSSLHLALLCSMQRKIGACECSMCLPQLKR